MKRTVRKVGFFAEFNPYTAKGNPSLRTAVQTVPSPHEASIVAYLRGGRRGWVHYGKPNDVLAEEWTLIAGDAGCLNTDGTWVWPDELAHYVEKYHVRLPDEFVRFMEEHNFVPPPVETEELEVEGWS